MVTTLKEAAEHAVEMGKHVTETVAGIGESAANKAAEVRDSTGKVLHGAACSVHGAADKLDAAGNYIENCSMKGAVSRMGAYGRTHMTGTLMVAAVFGLIAGTMIGRAISARA